MNHSKIERLCAAITYPVDQWICLGLADLGHEALLLQTAESDVALIFTAGLWTRQSAGVWYQEINPKQACSMANKNIRQSKA